MSPPYPLSTASCLKVTTSLSRNQLAFVVVDHLPPVPGLGRTGTSRLIQPAVVVDHGLPTLRLRYECGSVGFFAEDEIESYPMARMRPPRVVEKPFQVMAEDQVSRPALGTERQ